jgi:hypothetical protein
VYEHWRSAAFDVFELTATVAMLRHYQSTLAAVGLHLGTEKPANLQANVAKSARASRSAGLWEILQVCGVCHFAAF